MEQTHTSAIALTGSFGLRLSEFMAVGGTTLIVFPLAWLLRARVGLDSSELGVSFVMFHAAYFINDPHFSVSYLRFYRNLRDRAFGSALGAVARLDDPADVLARIITSWTT